jgi:hypothetical protein
MAVVKGDRTTRMGGGERKREERENMKEIKTEKQIE